MKIFISQPMNGRSNEEILNERNMVRELYPNDEIIDSFFQDAPDNATPLWYLGESIKLMGDADIVYFCNGWQNTRGCQIEHSCAMFYGKNICYQGNKNAYYQDR